MTMILMRDTHAAGPKVRTESGYSSGMDGNKNTGVGGEADISNSYIREMPSSLRSPKINELANHATKETGIVERHLVALQHVAQNHKTIIGVRPVEKIATSLIAAGYPTKGFHVKGKSASWGPQAGFICVDQGLSKLEGRRDLIDKFNKQTRSCINDRHAVSVPLTVTHERLKELEKGGYITMSATRANATSIELTAKAPSGKNYQFDAIPQHAGGTEFVIYYHNKPLDVLGPAPGRKALTADYDLFVIAPLLSDFGPNDRLPVPDIAHSELLKKIKKYKGLPSNALFLNSILDKNFFYKGEDSEIGNATTRIRNLIPVINRALVGGGEPVVHHNADSGSPATDPASNYPATFFLPEKIGRFPEISIIHNGAELADLFQAAKDSNYHVPLNPLWEKEVTSVRRTRFLEARKAIKNFHQKSKFEDEADGSGL